MVLIVLQSIQSLIPSVSFFNYFKLIHLSEYNQNISKGSLQRKIFVDELFAKVRDINFDPLEVMRKPEIAEAAAEIEDLQNFIKNSDLLHQQPGDYILKQAIDPADADPKRVLEKLEKILSDLMAAPAFSNHYFNQFFLTF